jgi:transposase-like protein
MSFLSQPHFHNEEAAYAYVEGKLWPEGPVCPHCGGCERIGKLAGASTRIGTYKCYQCRKPFTVKVGTIFESSHVPMRYWLQAIWLVCSSKKGFSANQLQRVLGVTLKTAWFMGHRIREAMQAANLPLFGGDGGAVEVDETFLGVEPGAPVKRSFHHKMKVVSVMDRTTKTVVSTVVDDVNTGTIERVLEERVSRNAHLMSDEGNAYRILGPRYAAHGVVHHGRKEYVNRDNPFVHTETVEGFYSIFKRGMRGVYQHCQKIHLQRYCNEFDFRYNHRTAKGIDDTQRSDALLLGVVGRRLTYRAMVEGSCRSTHSTTQTKADGSSTRHRSRWKTKPSRWKRVEPSSKPPSSTATSGQP